MKKGIHPEYGPATIRCGCGNSWETRATKADMRVEVCSACHPFFTGEQRIVDTAGRVERYRRRFGLQEEPLSAEGEGPAEAGPAEGGNAAADTAPAAEGAVT